MLLDSKDIKFDWQAAKFDLPDPDGKSYAIDELMGENGLLIAFVCNHCPYVKAIISHLVEDAKILQEKGIGVVAISANDYKKYPEDSPPKMKLFAEKHGFTFPYLIDEEQTTARAYDAVCTPDFFGLNSSGELQYRGRLDNLKMGHGENRVPELVNAMNLIAETGKGPREQTASIGCSIKWK
ncbi:thioredoxin family protein [Pseudobacteriovorax antillogorgiicola]|uniref:AhpC/TSA family protein n=1 Tax=Pseudobacteriovorax antillogorgiicola TaxID=1513793 RepID=A0A1Y6CQ55_9BACT|nr:thioredoxin family protein [Pseudobacteriovorax antillogorgiicola]TCS42219.1 AhpC/TSA family protein [Pseudobacteriovorax antillogorgiicola]SMF82777.1 AhpC/TSA family protein [Pseudobacteriovorax antillogorgiicola]